MKFEGGKMKEDDWIKLMYEEAWRQYNHEDNLTEKRNTRFLTIQTILYGIIGYLNSSSILNQLNSAHENKNILLFAISIMFIFILCTLAIIILIIWKSLNETSKKFLYVRFETIIEIESKYPKYTNLGRKEINYNKKMRLSENEGFNTTKKTIEYMITMWIVIILINIFVALSQIITL